MNFTSKKLLAAALLAAIPMGGAMACTTANWVDAGNGGGVVTGAPVAGSPPTVARYSGLCGLQGSAGNYVTNNAPNADGTYRARFYVYTGTTGTATVFKATASDAGAGAEVLRVDYTPPNFNFFQNGAASGSVAGIVANKWYGVEVSYVAGSPTGFSANVRGNVSFVGAVAPQAAGAGTVGSHSLGAVAGGAGNLKVDAFESTRSADTAIGFLCRGDSNNSGTLTAADRGAITSELAGTNLAAGQPDCNEDGNITAADRGCVTTQLGLGATCN